MSNRSVALLLVLLGCLVAAAFGYWIVSAMREMPWAPG